jgi:hypothetical protein
MKSIQVNLLISMNLIFIRVNLNTISAGELGKERLP